MEQLKPIRVTAHRWHVAANRQQASISTGHNEEKRNTHGHEAEVITDQFSAKSKKLATEATIRPTIEHGQSAARGVTCSTEHQLTEPARQIWGH